MAPIKSFSDLQQSKKLAEILPLESADIYWSTTLKTPVPYLATKLEYKMYKEGANLIPCWSLAALISVIRETIGYTLNGDNNVYMSCNLGDKPWKLVTEIYDNEVDACYEMILKLNELNLL